MPGAAELLLAAALTSAPASGDHPPEILARTSKWVVNYDRDSCHLAAQFGEGEALMVADFVQYQPGDRFDLAVYGKRLYTMQPGSDVRINFGLTGKSFRWHAVNGSSGKLPAIFLSSLRFDGRKSAEDAPTITPEQEASVTGVTLAVSGKGSFRLDFGPLDKPMAQMRDCISNLIKSWGYDPAEQAALQRRPTPAESPANWLNFSDYPPQAYAAGHNGMVQLRLDIGPDGKVTGCHVLARTNPDEFADATCKAVSRRAKFKPALDAQGRPVRSYWVQKARFAMGY